MTERDPPLWSERHGRGPKAAPLNLRQTCRLFANIVAEFNRRGWFQESFGFDCIDAGFVPGRLGEAVQDALLLETGRDNVWPVDEHLDTWDEDTLFDMVEYLFRNVSAGLEDPAHYHSFGDCGWHFATFDRDIGQQKYRSKINQFLPKYDDGYELSEEGAVVRVLGAEFSDLEQASEKSASLPPGDEELIQRAIQKFRSRDRSTQRDAIRDLADVLERNRKLIDTHLFSRDEAALYEIANKYWIRHNKPEERRDYNHEAWWDWIFHLYLSSIRLVQRLVAAQEGDPG